MASKPRRAGRYPAREFDLAAKSTGMTEHSVLIARSVLVDGLSLRAAARLHGRSHQWVAQSVNAMRDVLEARNPTPQNWVRDTATLPPELWRVVRQMEAEARKQLLESTRAPSKKKLGVARKRRES